MLQDVQFSPASVYAVEVSGWDRDQEFFVEKCELEWSEEAGKQVALKRNLRDNTILFVRLLESWEQDRSYPVVYRAEFLAETSGGTQKFRLIPVLPWVKEVPGAAA
jgi:hypothetical protein